MPSVQVFFDAGHVCGITACSLHLARRILSGQEPGEAFVVLGMPGSYLTEGNVFFGHYKGRQTIASVRLKSSPQDLQHRGFNLGYAVAMHKRPSWRQRLSARFSILASSPMWIENNYMGIVMVLTEALNIESIDLIRDQWGHVGSFFGYRSATEILSSRVSPTLRSSHSKWILCCEGLRESDYDANGTRIKDEPDQVIYPADLPHSVAVSCGSWSTEGLTRTPFSAFGWSLSAKADVDNNNTPDLVVGDFESQQVSLFSDSRRLQGQAYDTLSGPQLTRFTCLPTSKKRLQVVDGDGSSVLTGVVEVTLPGASDSQRLHLFDLTVEPKLRETREHLWKAVVVNASVELLPDKMPFMATAEAGQESTPAWTLHPSRGQRIFLSRPMFFANPVCGPDAVCVPQLDIEVYDSSIAHENPSTIYYRERVAERNLTVAVRNLGENAYDAKLRLKVPRQFGYVAGNSLGCKVEGDGTEEDPNSTVTTVLCNLPNPFTFANSQWDKFVFQLSTSGEEPVWQPPESLTVTAEITSDNENLGEDEEVKAHFTYNLELFANVEISSSSVDRTIIDTRNFSSQFIERQRVHPESLGPEVKHIFLISNSGPSPMENIWVNLSVPIQTQGGDFLVYLLDVIRSVSPSGGPPLRIPVLPEFGVNMLRLNAVDRSPANSGFHYGKTGRSKRDTQATRESHNRVFLPEYVEEDVRDTDQSQLPARAAAGPSLGPDRGRQLNVIECNRPLAGLGVPVCVEIPCRIDKLGRGDAVRIVMRGWVWADTLFRHKFSDVAVVTTATPVLPSQAFGLPVSGNFSIAPLSISQNLVFEGIKRLITQPFPLIPVIIGVVLGLLLLIFIAILMWWCGFFKRAKKPGADMEDETIQKPAQL
ncbi:unnamed protein product [Dibothriocephalus latus]|uniref:Uncharacterized protein n=1 Tax=Dibothriocephalus latus TaxID=60516 RepID=A0A3P6TZK7_DIBLA|nr:unnamed protein product [Dibothriocephalus latus]